MTDMSVPICRNCHNELPCYAFSFCPRCGMSVSTDNSYRSVVKERLPRNFYKIFLQVPDKSYEAGGMAVSVVRNKMPENVRHLVFMLADNSDTALAVFKNVVENFDKIPIDRKNELLRKIMKESKNPSLVAFANQLILNSPEIAEVAVEIGKVFREGRVAVTEELIRNSPKIVEVAVGFTPLNPYSKMIGKVVENMVDVRKRTKTMGCSLDSFM